MLTTVLLVFVLLVLLGGVGFWPAPGFTPMVRAIISAIIICMFVFWLLRFSPYAVR